MVAPVGGAAGRRGLRGGDLGRRARKSLEAIELYGKRHFARLERLRASTYILDLTLGGGAR